VEYGGAGGSPVPTDTSSYIAINTGEYILSVSTQHFTGDWDSYLGCSLTMVTSSGRTIGAGALSFVGSKAGDTTVCGSVITYTASTGKIVQGVSVGYGTCTSAPTHTCTVNAGCNVNNLGAIVNGQKCKRFVTGIVEVNAPEFCTRCNTGTYKTLTGPGSCTSCPDLGMSTSLAASIRRAPNISDSLVIARHRGLRADQSSSIKVNNNMDYDLVQSFGVRLQRGLQRRWDDGGRLLAVRCGYLQRLCRQWCLHKLRGNQHMVADFKHQHQCLSV
jgi:hypothetical protein